MPEVKNPSRAVFDVRPVDKNGRLDFSKIRNIAPVVNLAVAKNVKADIDWEEEVSDVDIPVKAEESKASIMSRDPEIFPRLAVKKEFEDSLNNLDASLIVSLGGQVHSVSSGRPRIKPIINKKKDVDINEVVKNIATKNFINHDEAPLIETEPLVQIENEPQPVIEPVVANLSEIDLLVSSFQTSPPPKNLYKVKPKREYNFKKIISWSVLVFVSGFGLVTFGGDIKDRATQNGELAVESLHQAEESIKNMDFVAAEESFASAYEKFSKAGQEINFLGASIGSVLADLPGAGKLKSANSIVEIGKLFSETGAAMTRAMDSLSGAASIFGGQSNSSPNRVFSSMTDALAVARSNIEKADKVAGNIDIGSIPEDKREQFQSALTLLPLFKKTVNQAFDYSKFFERLAGVYGSKRYLIMFQNQTELRPTGGFPGTYGLVSFQNGAIKDFKVDDVYNIDGQLKEKIVPPVQLQHITPTWAMRDANWFLDFPTSARKIMEFYKKESGLDVDGVIVINPEIVSDVIKIVGPIELKDYGMVLDSENFVAELQREVEYGKNRTQPKTVMLHFASALMDKIKSLDSDRWPEVFAAISLGLEKKNSLMYFKDLYLERFAIDNNFGGEIKNVDSDYLMVSFSNVKGSKTDRVTDTSIDLNTELKDGGMIHTVTISRTHNGGNDELGFYNKTNPSFVRMLVPEGAELISVSGHDNPSYQPLISYKTGFNRDTDLERLEGTFNFKPSGEATYSESGKTGFAFWMINKPGQTREVVVKYKVPTNLVTKNYSLYIQKQPGLKANLNYSLSSSQGFSVNSSTPSLSLTNGKYYLNSSFDSDINLAIKFD